MAERNWVSFMREICESTTAKTDVRMYINGIKQILQSNRKYIKKRNTEAKKTKKSSSQSAIEQLKIKSKQPAGFLDRDGTNRQLHQLYIP